MSGRRHFRPVASDLATGIASFLADFELENTPEWTEIVTLYFRTHLLPFFGSFDRFTLAAYSDYGRERLQHASRPTVRKELCALRRFVEWCREHGLELPAVPGLPKHGHRGTRAKNARKRKATIIQPAQAKRLLLAMPERSRKTGAFVRPLFVVLWETGLRPTTVLRLETPLHYVKGAKRLFISREIDKEGFERWVPLSAAARKALDRVCPKKPGRLFDAPKASLRGSLAAALRAAGLEHLDVSPYDFRHSRITHGANTPGVALAGIAHLVGHKHISTTALYVQTAEEAAAEALDVMAARAGSRRRPAPANRSGGHSGGHKAKTGGAKGGT